MLIAKSGLRPDEIATVDQRLAGALAEAPDADSRQDIVLPTDRTL